jgi:beta-lactamase class A
MPPQKDGPRSESARSRHRREPRLGWPRAAEPRATLRTESASYSASRSGRAGLGRSGPERGGENRSPVRAWLVLAALLAVVGAASVGRLNPLNAVEAVRGLTFSRPEVANVRVTQGRPDAALQASLDAAVVTSRGSVGAIVLDLEGGGEASRAADRSFPSASLFKLPILVEVLAQEQLHRLDPDELLEVRPEDWTDGSGVLQARVGDQLSVRELTRLMIQDSDNIAALILLDAVGSDTVNTTLDRLGLDGTRVVDRRRGEPGEHVTTARDTARLLSIVASGHLIDPTVSEAALRLLEQPQAHTWLADALPWWVKVAHKWGDLPSARHDAGIVFTPRGTFVSVVLTEDVPADEAQRVIARTALAGYEYLGATGRGRTAAKT